MRPRLDRRPFVVAAGVTVAGAVLGLQPGDAVLVGLVTLVLGVVGVSLDIGSEHAWPQARTEEQDGVRREISMLTWTFVGRDGRVSEVAVRRLRTDASRRLARRGVVVPGGLGVATRTSPVVDEAVRAKVRELLGDRAWRTLTAAGGLMPTLADVSHCVDVIERLGPDVTGAPVPPKRGVQP